MAIPRMAVTLSVVPVGVLAPLKTLPAWVFVDWAVYAPRRRNIAEGFSFESLARGKSVQSGFGRRRGERVRLTFQEIGNPSRARINALRRHIRQGKGLQEDRE